MRHNNDTSNHNSTAINSLFDAVDPIESLEREQPRSKGYYTGKKSERLNMIKKQREAMKAERNIAMEINND